MNNDKTVTGEMYRLALEELFESGIVHENDYGYSVYRLKNSNVFLNNIYLLDAYNKPDWIVSCNVEDSNFDNIPEIIFYAGEIFETAYILEYVNGKFKVTSCPTAGYFISFFNEDSKKQYGMYSLKEPFDIGDSAQIVAYNISTPYLKPEILYENVCEDTSWSNMYEDFLSTVPKFETIEKIPLSDKNKEQIFELIKSVFEDML